MYEHLTYEMILQRMLDRIPNNVDKREGSVIWDALAPAAVELKLMYIEFDYIMNESFADTASRPFLIRRCAERGITPDPATNTILRGEFAPANIDMTGRRFNMPSTNTSYIVKEQISGGVYQVQCEALGTQGNRYLGTIIPIDHINGLQTAELTEILIPAKDEEDIESLRQKYFDSFTDKAFGGNQKDYLNKTNSIEGVGVTKVTPVWDGGGTVKLTILDAQYNRASDVLIDKVQQEIDPTQDAAGLGLAPIGHVVTVDTVTEKAVNITMEIVFAEGFSWNNISERATELIQDYLLNLRRTWAELNSLVVRLTQIETRILSITGVIDVGNTRINGVVDNLTLAAHEIPVLGGVSV